MPDHKALIVALALLPCAVPGQAAEVRLRGSLLSSCILSLSTEGQLRMTDDPSVLASETSGGVPATMTVVAIGAAPTVNFTAPAIDAPGGFSGSAQAAIRYTSLGGTNQAYTSTASSSAQVRLLDTFTIHGRITSTEGFQAGNYAIRTTATCQQ